MKSIIKSFAISLAFLSPLSALASSSVVESSIHTLKASQLKDNSGLVYIGYDVDKKLISPYLAQLKVHLGDEKFNTFRAGQAKRDHHSFHITLINPFEYPNVKNIDVSKLPEITFKFEGLGTASKDAGRTFFVVTSSEKAQQVRKQHGLKNKDFHVTVGFDAKDVFGVSKGMDSLMEQVK
ncbi:hypothetical protein ACMAZF_16735 [Psychrobium sp. nBUS_13]|uniref:hypothetical protein n=1 Tax=Psychrobium sp. nBUS_13 TaxID=3395319 RepID=UPI003EBC5D46